MIRANYPQRKKVVAHLKNRIQFAPEWGLFCIHVKCLFFHCWTSTLHLSTILYIWCMTRSYIWWGGGVGREETRRGGRGVPEAGRTRHVHLPQDADPGAVAAGAHRGDGLHQHADAARWVPRSHARLEIWKKVSHLYSSAWKRSWIWQKLLRTTKRSGIWINSLEKFMMPTFKNKSDAYFGDRHANLQKQIKADKL